MTYQFQNISVLVIEESSEMLALIKGVLTTFGVGKVHGALGGEDGFQVFCKEDPDIVLADWLDEPMNGVEVARRIRTDALSPNPYVPFILMTGFSQKKRVTIARDAGITEFLVKPFSSHTLYRRIHQVIERPRQFVRASSFFGPDRRRREEAGHVPENERREDLKQKSKPRKAHEVARSMTEKKDKAS